MSILALLLSSNMYGQELEEYKWNNRVLIVETPNEANDKYRSQINEWVDLEKALIDRKLVIIELVGGKYKITNYLLEQNDEEWRQLKSKGEKSEKKIEKFKVTLIGLDGGVKLEMHEVLSKEKLFGIIDSMPMRRSEIRGKGER